MSVSASMSVFDRQVAPGEYGRGDSGCEPVVAVCCQPRFGGGGTYGGVLREESGVHPSGAGEGAYRLHGILGLLAKVEQ